MQTIRYAKVRLAVQPLAKWTGKFYQRRIGGMGATNGKGK